MRCGQMPSTNPSAEQRPRTRQSGSIPTTNPGRPTDFRYAYFMAGRYEDALRVLVRQPLENYNRSPGSSALPSMLNSDVMRRPGLGGQGSREISGPNRRGIREWTLVERLRAKATNGCHAAGGFSALRWAGSARWRYEPDSHAAMYYLGGTQAFGSVTEMDSETALLCSQ